ncbi:ATP-binding protein [Roseibium aggregatum]|uniref:YobI family P-loop NTPase n=1 Tax=Roseibium aggregatum TaxID=187304 RepID=UPI001E4EED7D|nr:ATP-binding protein [Roseibium aggregatum]
MDLAPTDNADETGIYSGALLEATRNRNVFNIALTGPYGSGKSSIIKTFLKRYKKYGFLKKPALQISLAAFLPEADATGGNVSKQEIERSILQQMLYGADANNLPLSRFKRIQSPRWWSWIVSLFIIFGIVACWNLIQHRKEILDGSFFLPFNHTNWFNLSCVAIGFLFIWQTLHHIYIKSFGVSLKSISLKNIEITPEAAEEESILNRHLDEIIYFFQSTKYDLVIIEDLDRFNNPDVFVTLREINSLVNANAGVKRQIRFLYALRDNMFANTDRTKFFEFIVPVIPIINSSNSIDKVIEQGERLALDERLDRQFLREVSRYLNDLRLIHNIFNEYAIYIKNLESDQENHLDENKLLAVLIYKNVLPSDFEELHREKGKLAEILNRHSLLISNAEKRYKANIIVLERQIRDAEQQVPADIEELRKIYAMSLINKIPANYNQIEFNHNRISVHSLTDNDSFEEIIEVNNIICWSMQNHRTNTDIANFQSEVNANKSYQERKKEIEHKSAEFKASATKTIAELREKISSLRKAKFNEIIRTDGDSMSELFDAFGENSDLVRFLVFEGFLDDTYYQYTSLFHSGRLSPNDNKFLIQIRAFKNPEPDFQIDNPKEVIAAMRDSDFSQNFVLNVILVDCMFGNPDEYNEQIAKFVTFISSNFSECDAFFSSYYERGKHIPAVISKLIEEWSGFLAAALQSSQKYSHVARLIAHLPDTLLKSLHKRNAALSEFLAANLSEILELNVDFEPNRLKLIPFETHNLETIRPYPAIARVLTDEGLYRISTENIEFVFRDVLGLRGAERLQTKNYSTLLECENSCLIDKVEENFEFYLRNILLKLEHNNDENISSIIDVLNHDEVGSDQLEEFIEKQSSKLPSILDVPLRLYAAVFKLEKIEASWENCLEFINSENFDANTLTTFLETEATQNVLSKIIVPAHGSALPLRQFLFNNHSLEESCYRSYIQKLPKQFKQFPDNFDADKLRILIEEKTIILSVDSFSYLSEHHDLQVLFIATNINGYFENKALFELDDDFREELLRSNITDQQKLEIVEDMDLSLLAALPNRASLIGDLYHRTGADISHLSAEAAQALITCTRPITAQISLFNRCQKLLTVGQIKQVLQQMPDPFPDFQPGWQQPRIPTTTANTELVEWLVAREIISSWKKTFLGDIRIYNFRRK